MFNSLLNIAKQYPQRLCIHLPPGKPGLFQRLFWLRPDIRSRLWRDGWGAADGWGNLFGVAETNVQTQEVSIAGLDENRLVIDLPGITDINDLVLMQSALLNAGMTAISGSELAGVPEPSTLLLAVVAIFLFVMHRRLN
jgi:hypothetical protein